ncbi:thioesterase family protein [Sphingomonas sp. HH69]|uniref:thioesterase family protein n=1 Tax=Sphingobium aromaticiconvertens TaxID=365341 RepID=UPI0011D16665
MSEYQFSGTVHWSETDASGRFHFSNALLWAENAEHSLCRSIDPDVSISRMPRRSISANFSRPFLAADKYIVNLSIEKLGTSSISYAWIIESLGEVAVEGRHVVVHIDEDGRPAPIPASLRIGLEKYLAARSDR